MLVRREETQKNTYTDLICTIYSAKYSLIFSAISLSQNIGFYLSTLVQLGWHTDSWEQSGPSYGGQDRGRVYTDTPADGPREWMSQWTIFFWGFWYSYAPFVGTFLAKISRGRTIREFINGSMVQNNQE